MAFRGEKMEEENEKNFDKSLASLVHRKGDMDD
jgi:hypothetical protein